MCKKINLILFVLFVALVSFAGKNVNGYEIKFKIKGLSNEKLVIAYRYADNQYIKDTLMLDANGATTWTGEKKLNRGVYLGVVPSMNNNFFEFLVSDVQIFGLETDKADLNRSMKVTGSKENQMFFDDLLYMSNVRTKADEYVVKSKDANADTAKFYKSKLESLDKEVKNYRTNLIKANPGTLYSKILNALQEREPATVPRNKDGSAIDTNFAYNDYHEHYWDNIDFSEEGLIRSPIYSNKLETYFEKTIAQIPDSINKECDMVIKKARANSEIFKYTLVTLLNKYAASKIMGMDAVYVHLVDNYYAKGDAPWVDTTTLAKMKMEANKKRNLLIGKIAPNLYLPDTTNMRSVNMYDIKSKYTLLVFWDPDCGHCKKEIPQLAQVYPKLKPLGVTIYSIATIAEEERDHWKEFIRVNGLDFINVADYLGYRTLYDISSTPVIYILDANKKIIAKRIGVDQLEDFISKHDEFEMKKKIK
jgi:peroxiredoxin